MGKRDFAMSMKTYQTILADFGVEKANEWADSLEDISPAAPFLPITYKAGAESMKIVWELYPDSKPTKTPEEKWGTIIPDWER